MQRPSPLAASNKTAQIKQRSFTSLQITEPSHMPQDGKPGHLMHNAQIQWLPVWAAFFFNVNECPRAYV